MHCTPRCRYLLTMVTQTNNQHRHAHIHATTQLPCTHAFSRPCTSRGGEKNPHNDSRRRQEQHSFIAPPPSMLPIGTLASPLASPTRITLGGGDLAANNRKLFIGGLSYETSDESLGMYFEQFGQVASSSVLRESTTGRSRGFGFVTFAKIESAKAALAQARHIVDGRMVEAKFAVPRRKTDDGGEDGELAQLAANAMLMPPPMNSAFVPISTPSLTPGDLAPLGSVFYHSQQLSPSLVMMQDSSPVPGGASSTGATTAQAAGAVSNRGTPPAGDIIVNKIFVGGLRYATGHNELRQYFEQFGEVETAQVIFNRDTKKSRGFGFVVFKDPESVDRVLAKQRASPPMIDGKQIEVKACVARQDMTTMNAPTSPRMPPKTPILSVEQVTRRPNSSLSAAMSTPLRGLNLNSSGSVVSSSSMSFRDSVGGRPSPWLTSPVAFDPELERLAQQQRSPSFDIQQVTHGYGSMSAAAAAAATSSSFLQFNGQQQRGTRTSSPFESVFTPLSSDNILPQSFATTGSSSSPTIMSPATYAPQRTFLPLPPVMSLSGTSNGSSHMQEMPSLLPPPPLPPHSAAAVGNHDVGLFDLSAFSSISMPPRSPPKQGQQFLQQRFGPQQQQQVSQQQPQQPSQPMYSSGFDSLKSSSSRVGMQPQQQQPQGGGILGFGSMNGGASTGATALSLSGGPVVSGAGIW